MCRFYFAEVASQVLNRCVTHSPDLKPSDKEFWYKFDYTFLDDTYFDYNPDTFDGMHDSEGKQL